MLFGKIWTMYGIYLYRLGFNIVLKFSELIAADLEK